MDSVRFDVDRVLSQELQDLLNACGVGQAAQAHAVTRAVGGGEVLGRGHDRHGYDGRRGQGGDQRGGHVAVQHLSQGGRKVRPIGQALLHC